MISRRTRGLCAAVAALVAVAAAPTFFVDGILNSTPVMNGSARGTALTMFALALPMLAVGLVTSTRGSIRGRAALIGALAYLTYNATLLVYATPFNELFLAYVALLALSLWSLVSALLDPQPHLAPDNKLPALATRPGHRGRAALAATTRRRLPRRSRAVLLDDRGDRCRGRPVVRSPSRSRLRRGDPGRRRAVRRTRLSDPSPSGPLVARGAAAAT